MRSIICRLMFNRQNFFSSGTRYARQLNAPGGLGFITTYMLCRIDLYALSDGSLG